MGHPPQDNRPHDTNSWFIYDSYNDNGCKYRQWCRMVFLWILGKERLYLGLTQRYQLIVLYYMKLMFVYLADSNFPTQYDTKLYVYMIVAVGVLLGLVCSTTYSHCRLPSRSCDWIQYLRRGGGRWGILKSRSGECFFNLPWNVIIRRWRDPKFSEKIIMIRRLERFPVLLLN